MTVKSCKLLNIYAALTRSTAFNLTNKIDSTHFYSHRLCDPPRHRSVSQIKLCRKWLRPDDDHPASDTSTANLSVQPIFCPQQGGLISLLWDKISMYIEEYIVQLIFSCFGSVLGLKSCKTCRRIPPHSFHANAQIFKLDSGCKLPEKCLCCSDNLISLDYQSSVCTGDWIQGKWSREGSAVSSLWGNSPSDQTSEIYQRSGLGDLLSLSSLSTSHGVHVMANAGFVEAIIWSIHRNSKHK